MGIFPRFSRILGILALGAVLAVIVPGRGAAAQHRVYLPVILNSLCTKDLVFLAFGDSITDCYMDTNLCSFPQCGYPLRLYEQLKSRFNRNFAFYNVGMGGERTADGLARLADTLIHPGDYNVSPIFCPAAPSNFYPGPGTNTRPDLIIIMEGTNDLGDWAANGVPDLEEIAANIRAMAETSLRAGTKVVLATLTPVVPVNEHRQLQGQGTADLSLRIRQIAAELDIPLADVHAVFTNYPDWQNELMSTALGENDGLHPNDLGFAVMAEILYQTLLGRMTPDGCLN